MNRHTSPPPWCVGKKSKHCKRKQKKNKSIPTCTPISIYHCPPCKNPQWKKYSPQKVSNIPSIPSSSSFSASSSFPPCPNLDSSSSKKHNPALLSTKSQKNSKDISIFSWSFESYEEISNLQHHALNCVEFLEQFTPTIFSLQNTNSELLYQLLVTPWVYKHYYLIFCDTFITLTQIPPRACYLIHYASTENKCSLLVQFSDFNFIQVNLECGGFQNVRLDNLSSIFQCVANQPRLSFHFENYPCVIAGDFQMGDNFAVIYGKGHEPMMSNIGFVDSFRNVYPDHHSNPGYTVDPVKNPWFHTYPSDSYSYRYDQQFFRQLTVVSAKIIQFKQPLSDHFPLFIEYSK